MLTGKDDLFQVEDKRVVLLQSGGLDSCYLACLFNRHGFEVHHVFIDYRQNARVRELESAEKIVEKYGGELHVVDLDMPWLESSTLLRGHRAESFENLGIEARLSAVTTGTYVPMRNHIFLGIASSLAEALKIKYIASGLDGWQDEGGRPQGGTTDKHPNFVREIERSLREGSAMTHVSHNDFELIVPILAYEKHQVINNGLFIGCDFSLSWTCYNNGDKPCGVCGSCGDRRMNFEYLDEIDPVEYEDQ